MKRRGLFTKIFIKGKTTMESQTLIQIELIKPNPYQPRQGEDPDVVAEIAQSIRQNGLMQVPTARRVDGHYQLAFGHTRLAAFRLIGEPSMPLIVRELTDLQMFELGVAENIKRRDLNPIELADAMCKYMQEFNKNSVETGAFFNVSPEKVRSTIRLLNLPENLQAGVADGTITQNNARRLLTIQRVAPEEVDKVSKKLKGDKDPDLVISEVLKDTGRSVEMWQRWQSGEPLAGSKLWKLTTPADKFPMDHLPELKAADVTRSLEIPKNENLQKWIDWLRMGFVHGPMAPTDKLADESVAEYLVRTGAPADVIEKIAHLLNPPSCSACPFYAKVDGSHYCTFKPCHGRKTKAWEDHIIQSASKRTGIAIYDKRADGDSAYLSSYDEPDKKLFTARNADLRLKKGTNWSQRFEGVPEGYSVVVVGATLKKMRKATATNSANRDEKREDYYKEQKRLAAMRRAHEAAIYNFLWNIATPAFLGVYNGLNALDFLETMADRFVRGVPAEEPDKKKATKAERVKFYQRAILFSLWDDELWEFVQNKKPVTALAKHLVGVANSWAIKLPKNWLDQAAEADKAIVVTTETEE
jgi:ParB/RepB/Spo0J family partition protein